MSNNKKIIIIGGGAGGLELVSMLCGKFRKKIDITLVDAQLKHIWKPLYHEVAAGTLNNYYDEIDYISYSYQKGFKFIFGLAKQIDCKNKQIIVNPLSLQNNKPAKNPLCLEYDILVLAVGSEANDFNIPGVKKFCFFLDSLPQAELCNEALVRQIVLATQYNKCGIIHIIGGGATGVELAAEFNYVLTEARKYQLTNMPPYEFKITIIEAGNRILGMLPTSVSQSVSNYLQSNKIEILTNTKVAAVEKEGILTSEGKLIKSSMTVWAAGIKGNLATISHPLEVNKLNQFVVKSTLQATKDDSIFAFGDCASLVLTNKDGKSYVVPPRAQVAHQQAGFLVKSVKCYLNNEVLPIFHYRDYGSLISLSKKNVIGNLMNIVTKNFYVEGFFARLAYWLLYKRHLIILKGYKYVILSTLANMIITKQRPEIKLH